MGLNAKLIKSIANFAMLRMAIDFTPDGEQWCHCFATVALVVDEAELLGTAGGGTENALDIGLYDKRVRNTKYASKQPWKKDL